MVVPGWTRTSKCCFQPLSTCMDGAYTGIGTVGLIAIQVGKRGGTISYLCLKLSKMMIFWALKL